MSGELDALPCSAERKVALREVIARYVALERAVQQAHIPVCAPTCAKCVKICCAHKFCTEAIESPWLRLVWEQAGHSEAEFDAVQGWLTPTGCKLTAGRPPVCYAFLCSQILDPMPDRDARDFHLDQAALITRTGRRAYGERSLVELSRDDIASRLNLSKLDRAIAAAWRELESAGVAG